MGSIVYMTAVEFMEFADTADKKFMGFAHFIIDEFDGLLFEEEQTTKMSLKAL
jgi:hypothetical protein